MIVGTPQVEPSTRSSGGDPLMARRDRHSHDLPEGDAREVALQLHHVRRGTRALATEEIR